MDFGSDDLGGSGPMKPGRRLFSEECKAVLGRLIIGDHSDDVLNHIHACGPCFMVVFGDGNIMPTSIFDDIAGKNLLDEVKARTDGRVPPSKEVLEHAFGVTLNEFHVLVNTSTVPGDPAAGPMGLEANGTRLHRGTDEDADLSALVEPSTAPIERRDARPPKNLREVSRRKVIGLAIAATAAAALCVFPFFTRTSEATRSPRSATTGLQLTPARQAILARWDSTYQTSGVAGVRAILARANAFDLRMGFDWIAERRITALYPDLVVYLMDPNTETRRGALRNLIRVPAVDLKIHLVAIQAARNVETDLGLQAALDELIKVVTKA